MSSLIEHSRINYEILDCVSIYNLSMHHIDCEMTFLNSDLGKEVCLKDLWVCTSLIN